LLLKDGRSDLEVRGAIGFTPLVTAITSGFPGVVRLLLHEGADALTTDDYDFPALGHALRPRYPKSLFLMRVRPCRS
jgi:hypothetical protein